MFFLPWRRARCFSVGVVPTRVLVLEGSWQLPRGNGLEGSKASQGTRTGRSVRKGDDRCPAVWCRCKFQSLFLAKHLLGSSAI